MKKILSSLFLLLLIVSCVEKTPTANVSYNILDSIPEERPVLEGKYNLDKATFKNVVDVIFNNGTVEHSKLPQGV